MSDQTTPLPLDGEGAGGWGARADVTIEGAQGVVDNASCATDFEGGASTPSQPSPIEGEGFVRFGNTTRASNAAIVRARRLRSQPTRIEAKLWEELRKLPVRFRRQAPMGRYVADFVCHPAALVIEVDGGVHNRTDVALRDLERDAWFETQGYAVLRIATREIETDLGSVLTKIRNVVPNRLRRVI